MEERNLKSNHILESPFSNPSEEAEGSMKYFPIEPEMEEFNDTIFLKSLLDELGIPENLFNDCKPLKHQPENSECIHCKLLQKTESFKSNIEKKNQELRETNEILKLKKRYNREMKEMIFRIEESLNNFSFTDSSNKKKFTC